MAQKKPQNILKSPRPSIFWLYGIILVIILGWNFLASAESPVATSWEKVKQTMLKNDEVKKMVAVRGSNIVEVYLRDDKVQAYKAQKEYKNIPAAGPQFTFNISSVEGFKKDFDSALVEYGIPEGKVGIDYRDKKGTFMEFFLNNVIFIVLLIVAWIVIMRIMSRNAGGGGGGGNVFSVGKAKAQLFDKENSVKITFKDVAGLEEAKVEVMEIVDFLKNPRKYSDLGGKIPKGALLVGPPGTGKTLLAKAVAGEANVPFFSISGSDFVEMFVGVGASRVRDLFRQAKEKAPCIVFIDEIDAIGRARGKNVGFSSNDERENTLNQLLTEMDGFGTNAGVIILAATNRVDILDKALLRAGRFDRQIHVELPDMKERAEIFDVYLKKLKLHPDFDASFLGKQTPGFSGADIANVCNEAALIAARKNKPFIDKADFLDAIDRIIGGLERKNKILTRQEKRSIAFHEAGHATVSWLLEYAQPLIKVTIIPRGRALGAAWYTPDERQIVTKEQMMHQLASTLGGRASEEIVFGKISSGALSDLESSTRSAYAMIAYYGMGDKLRNMSYYDSSGQSDMGLTKPYSEQTAQEIDREAKAIIDEAYELSKKVLNEHLDGLTQLAELLIAQEVIFTEDMERIFGKRQWKARIEEFEAEVKADSGENGTPPPVPAQNPSPAPHGGNDEPVGAETPPDRHMPTPQTPDIS